MRLGGHSLATCPTKSPFTTMTPQSYAPEGDNTNFTTDSPVATVESEEHALNDIHSKPPPLNLAPPMLPPAPHPLTVLALLSLLPIHHSNHSCHMLTHWGYEGNPRHLGHNDLQSMHLHNTCCH